MHLKMLSFQVKWPVCIYQYGFKVFVGIQSKYVESTEQNVVI